MANGQVVVKKCKLKRTRYENTKFNPRQSQIGGGKKFRSSQIRGGRRTESEIQSNASDENSS
jgi:hypothetical protein